MKKKHYNIKVTGKVQGVWFRKYTGDNAKTLHLTGFVSNKSDGSVYIEVEGTDDNLQAFIIWLHKGSPLSQVKSVEVSEGMFADFKNFSIQH